jgi:hypothetical protein
VAPIPADKELGGAHTRETTNAAADPLNGNANHWTCILITYQQMRKSGGIWSPDQSNTSRISEQAPTYSQQDRNEDPQQQ